MPALLPCPWAVPVALGLYLALFLRPKILDKCILCARSAYVIAAFSLLVILPKVVPHAFRSGVQEHASFERTMGPPVSPSAPRIVWVLLDELSYDQTFEHRQPDLALPNLDALSKTSMVFSAVQPVGTMTQELLPALLLGKTVAVLRTDYTGLPSYRSKDGGPWERFNQHDTIFGDAQSLGWSSGLVGWYNPYCRLLPDVLSRCFWQYSRGQSHRAVALFPVHQHHRAESRCDLSIAPDLPSLPPSAAGRRLPSDPRL